MQTTDLRDIAPDEDGERREPSAARRIGFTIAAIAMFLGFLSAQYIWFLDFIERLTGPRRGLSFLNENFLRVAQTLYECIPASFWIALFLFPFVATVLFPAALLSFARRNSPTNFRSEHWIWSTLLFWGCGLWAVHINLRSAGWFTPWDIAVLNTQAIEVSASWFALILPATGASIFAARGAFPVRPRSMSQTIRNARAARLRLTSGVALLYCWLQCTVYASGVFDSVREALLKTSIRPFKLFRPLAESRHDLNPDEKLRIEAFQTTYLDGAPYTRQCLFVSGFALVVFTMLKVARNRYPLIPRDSWLALLACLVSLGLSFTYHTGTLDLFAFALDSGAPHPSILSFGLTDPILVALLPFLALLSYVAWRDWRSATTQLREHEQVQVSQHPQRPTKPSTTP